MSTEQELQKNNTSQKEFQNLLDKDFKDRRLKENEIIKATVTEITKNYIIVDCKAKMEGMIPVEEFKNDDELSKIKQEVDNLKSMIDQLKNNITKMKDNKPKQLDKMLEWKKNANEFQKALQTFSGSSMIKDIELIKTKLNSVKAVYQETANETILNKVVPEFRLLEENAHNALELIKKIKTDMERIKNNYFARASASELNADLKLLIAGAHLSTDLLLSIRMFLEQYHTESGWKSFFDQSGGAKTAGKKPRQLGYLLFDFTAIKNKDSYFKKYLSIKDDNNELNDLGNNFITDFCNKEGIKINLTQFFNMYKNE